MWETMSKLFNRRGRRRTVALVGLVVIALVITLAFRLYAFRAPPHVGKVGPSDGGSAGGGLSENSGPTESVPNAARGKIRREGDRQFLWAKGPRDPEADSSEWFDMTGSPLPLSGFQYGIGRDTIPSIDNPVFVKADDPRLRRRWGQPTDAGVPPAASISDLKVIGFEHNGVARAYPIRLLNRHELVNDNVGGKPVTIGW